jgi:hypothetical protein
MSLENNSNKAAEPEASPEFAAFDDLTGVLLSVPVKEIRSKLDHLRNREVVEKVKTLVENEELNRKDPD